MKQQDIDDELSTTGAQELLTSTSAAHLAYVGDDGAPRVIPVGFFWTGDQVVISTARTAPKVAALSARPDVALAIEAGGTPDQARTHSPLRFERRARKPAWNSKTCDFSACGRTARPARRITRCTRHTLPSLRRVKSR